MTVIDVIKTLVEKFEGRPYFGYSGRGMYGKKCVGIVCDYPGEVEDYCDELGFDKPSIDNMGLDYIVYWTNINFTEEEYNMSEAVELNEVEELTEQTDVFEEEEMEEEAVAEDVVVEEVVVEEEEQEEVSPEPVEQPAVVLTEKQLILMNIFKSDVDREWIAADLANETTELTKRQINGVLASMKKKGVIVKNTDGWSITDIGRSC